MSGDDDLRFGDLGGDGGGDNDILDIFRQLIIGAIMLYVLLVVLQALFGIPIPFI